MRFTIEALCLSDRKGGPKRAVDEVRLIEDAGVEGDAHAGSGHRQVSFLAGEAVDTLRAEGLELEPGAFGENVLTRGMDWTRSKVGGRIRIGGTLLEITQLGKECHTPCAIYRAAGRCIMPDFGIFAKVIKGGIIHAGDRGDYGLGQGL
ncbi:MAG: MOSC domain-containing protein [Candidatus Aminicenantes bacterium]|nr:MOSC domain-containing protein [Candidatus Aminicenantes bacterium]